MAAEISETSKDIRNCLAYQRAQRLLPTMTQILEQHNMNLGEPEYSLVTRDNSIINVSWGSLDATLTVYEDERQPAHYLIIKPSGEEIKGVL